LRPAFICGTHGHVNIFKNQLGRDAASAIGGFDQIVAGLAAMFPAKSVDEEEGSGELLGFDQEASAINLPRTTIFSHVHLPFGGRENEKTDFSFLGLPIFKSCSPTQPTVAGGCWLNLLNG
jgi:hypothetical protein